ncbi:MAG TPA: magnesium transporter [Steroidobacteraceae bacterium]|nr:magnesium transporter [Steroidobacteraceae bacterium]
MSEPVQHPQISKERRLAALRAALREGSWRGAARMIAGMHPAEIANLIESLPPAQREVVWNFVEPEIEGDVLLELNDEARQSILEGMNAEELLAASEDMEVDDLADLVGDLPETVGAQLVKSMDTQDRERLNTLLSYEPDTAGGLMNTDTVSVRADVTVEVVLRYLRMRGELPDKTDRLFVVDRNDFYLGTVALTRLLTDDPEKPVGDILDIDAPRIAPDLNANDVSRLFQDRDLVSAAVVETGGKLLGRITIDDVVDVIREEAAHEVMSSAGLRDEEDVFAGVFPSTRRRLVWLGINLVTAFLAAAVVSRFEGTIEKVAALAALMPIVASMGGIAGTQTVTLIIRGIALGQVEWVNARWLLWKEIAVGSLNGLIWAVIVGSVTVVWFGSWKISAIIAAATLTNLFAAAAVGTLVPLFLKRMRIDPALSAGVILTTFTDCIGFATLLGLGSLFLT